MSILSKSVDVYEDIKLLTDREMRELLTICLTWNGLLNQTIRVKSAIKKAPREVGYLKEIIDESFSYTKPKKDPNHGQYDDYLHEIKKSVLALREEMKNDDFKEVLLYLRDRATEERILEKFDDAGEWEMAIDDINEHLKALCE